MALLPVGRRNEPSHPFPTGAAANLLGTTEPKLAETVRRGRISPAPIIVAGRRLWTHEQVVEAAAVLGVLNDDLRQTIDAAFGIAASNATATGGATS